MQTSLSRCSFQVSLEHPIPWTINLGSKSQCWTQWAIGLEMVPWPSQALQRGLHPGTDKRKPFLSDHRSWSCLGQWRSRSEQGEMRRDKRRGGVRRNETTVLKFCFCIVHKAGPCPPGYVAHGSVYPLDFYESLLTVSLLSFLSPFGSMFTELSEWSFKNQIRWGPSLLVSPFLTCHLP